MFRLQAVDGYGNLQSIDRAPRRRDGPHRARDDLRVDAARRELRQNRVELAIPHERLAADDRHVEWTMSIDEREDALDERLTFEVRELTQRRFAAQ